MGLVVIIEVQTMHRATNFTVFKHAFRPISKWDNLHSLTTNRHSCCHIIHFCIAHIRCYITMHPRIQYACAINAKQNTQPIKLRGIVGMGKGVDTTLRIVVHIA